MFAKALLGKSLLKNLVLVFCLSLITQGCGPDSFSTKGNGHPYEGLTVDGETPDRGPASEDDVGQASNARDGGNVQKKFETHYVCQNPTSELIREIRFGIRPNGSRVVIVRPFSGKGYETAWPIGQQYFAIYREINNDFFLMNLMLERVLSSEGGAIVAKYKTAAGDYVNEIFACQATENVASSPTAGTTMISGSASRGKK